MPLQGEGECWGPDASAAAVLPKPRCREKSRGPGATQEALSCRELGRQKRDNP